MTCQMRYRLHRIESGQEVRFTWGGEVRAALWRSGRSAAPFLWLGTSK